MERRTYLGSLGVAGFAGIAGCLNSLGLGNSNTALPPADDHPSDPSYPSHGNEFPSFSIPDPIAGTTVSLEDFVGERPFLLTYFYTSCPDGVCPALLTRLQWVQEDAAERDYADDIALLAFTFDPKNDTAEALKDHAEGQHLDYEADNFHFLRPETNEEAKQIMEEKFGMPITTVDESDDGNESSEDDGHGGNESHDDGGHSGNESHNGNESHDDGAHAGHTQIVHSKRITLVNEDGYVERAYPKAVQSEMAVTKEQLLEDVGTVAGVE
ncbi:SCO family protein [Haloterrigena salifodinae]|uniref:SCO family protein n=1 Tax=Haloterrigena salifodinae TaxID=2675099 RepID=UPI000F8916CE|nr:SCO family protein [Haloterrigena salifodinae]